MNISCKSRIKLDICTMPKDGGGALRMRKKGRFGGERCRKRRIIREVIALGSIFPVFNSQSLTK